MVDVLGHFAMALIWSLPAWLLWDRRVSVAFVATVLSAAMIPDVDLYLPGVVHHGPTHTILFTFAVATVGSALLTVAGGRTIARWTSRGENELTSPTRTFAFVASALFLGGLSHVFADMLATSARELRVEPFWPFFEKPFSIYVIHQFSDPTWNSRFLLVALLLHLAFYFLVGRR